MVTADGIMMVPLLANTVQSCCFIYIWHTSTTFWELGLSILNINVSSSFMHCPCFPFSWSPWHSQELEAALYTYWKPWLTSWQPGNISTWEASWNPEIDNWLRIEYNLVFIQSVVWPFSALWSTGGNHRMESATQSVKVKGRVWSQRLPLKCEETALCGISMHLLILSSVCLLLPVTPTATITCHPSRHLTLSSLSTLPLHFSLSPILACHLSSSSSPSSRPSVVVSLLFKFTPHKFPLVRTLPCPPSGRLPWWQAGWMIDRAWCLWVPPPLFETPHTFSQPSANESHTAVTQRCTHWHTQ